MAWRSDRILDLGHPIGVEAQAHGAGGGIATDYVELPPKRLHDLVIELGHLGRHLEGDGDVVAATAHHGVVGSLLPEGVVEIVG